MQHSLVLKPPDPSVCHLQYWCWGRPCKTEWRAMMYLDMWRSGTFLLYRCKVAFRIQEMLPRLMSIAQSYGPRSWSVVHSLACFWECATTPHIQVRHHTWLSFTSTTCSIHASLCDYVMVAVHCIPLYWLGNNQPVTEGLSNPKVVNGTEGFWWSVYSYLPWRPTM